MSWWILVRHREGVEVPRRIHPVGGEFGLVAQSCADAWDQAVRCRNDLLARVASGAGTVHALAGTGMRDYSCRPGESRATAGPAATRSRERSRGAMAGILRRITIALSA